MGQFTSYCSIRLPPSRDWQRNKWFSFGSAKLKGYLFIIWLEATSRNVCFLVHYWLTFSSKQETNVGNQRTKKCISWFTSWSAKSKAVSWFLDSNKWIMKFVSRFSDSNHHSKKLFPYYSIRNNVSKYVFLDLFFRTETWNERFETLVSLPISGL